MAHTNPGGMEWLISQAVAAAGERAPSGEIGYSGNGEASQNGEVLKEEECGTEEKPVRTEESGAGETDESLAAEELLHCREELRRTREELNRLRESVRREEKETPQSSNHPTGSAMASQPGEKPLPAFSCSLLSGGVEAGEDRYRQVMGL